MILLGHILIAAVAAVVLGCVYAIVSQHLQDRRFDKFIHAHPGIVSTDEFDALVQNRRTQ